MKGRWRVGLRKTESWCAEGTRQDSLYRSLLDGVSQLVDVLVQEAADPRRRDALPVALDRLDEEEDPEPEADERDEPEGDEVQAGDEAEDDVEDGQAAKDDQRVGRVPLDVRVVLANEEKDEAADPGEDVGKDRVGLLVAADGAQIGRASC